LATAFFYYLATFNPGLESRLGYLPIPLGEGGGPLEIRYGQILSIAVIFALAIVNYFGVRAGGGLQVFVTIIKVALIVVLIGVGLTAGQANTGNFSTSVAATGGVAGFFAAMVAALWAYDGWNNVTMVASEVKNPQRNLPLALATGTGAVVLLYLLTNAAYFSVLSAPEVAGSDRVAATMMDRLHGSFGAGAVSIAAMISIFAALNGSILTGSRVPFAMARNRLFFHAIAKVDEKHHSPANSILLLSGWSMVLVLSGRYEQLFTYVIFASWILYGMATASVIVLRIKRPDLQRPYRTLGYPVVPILFVLVAGALIFNTLQTSPRESILGLGLIFAGIPFYFYWRGKSAS
jgi:APA family basic amino acid/polyamine antiporter